MMIDKLTVRAALAAALAAALPAAAVPAAAVQDLHGVVERVVGGLDEVDEEALWTHVLELRALVEAHSAEDLAEALQGLLAGGDATPSGRLVAAAGLLQLPDGDLSTVAAALRPLLVSPEATIASAAAGLLGQARFRQLPTEERAGVVSELLEGAADGARAPGVRMRSAEAAWVLGRGQDRRTARRELLEFLRSSDPQLRADAALILAGIGDEVTGALRDELERLARLPGRRGALAASYVQRELAYRRSDRRYKELKEDYDRQVLPAELAQFSQVLELVEEVHLDGDKVERDELLDAALDGMLMAMDEHSSYMSPETYGRFYQDLEALYGGIGAYVGEDARDGLFTITRPIYSGPAYRAGLSTDDKIVRIDDWPTPGQPVDEIIKRLKGRPGTRVKLFVWRTGMDPALIDRPTDDMVVWVTREQIEIPTVKVDMFPGKIGLIELRDFSRVASKEVREGLEWLKSQGMRGLIFDLRMNSGGLLPEAVNVSDLFLPAGEPVVSTESRVYPPRTHYTQNPPALSADVPIAVLVDRFSASAAEIVAGALQDHERAALIGERTFGKGSVQDLLRVPEIAEDQFQDENGNRRYDNWEKLTVDHDGDGEFDFAPRVKMTIARYLLPSGRSIHRELDEDRNLVQQGGVVPDTDVARRRHEYWRLEEYNRISRQERIPQQYVDEHWEAYRDLFRELAACDRKDPSFYPDFDELYSSLDTPLPRDDVRYLLRQAVRRRVQDDRGAEFPFADYQEDFQTQEAVRHVLAALGREPGEFVEYRTTFTDTPVESTPPLAAVFDRPSRDELARTRSLLLRVRNEGGDLTPEELETLLEVLDSMEADQDG